MPYAPPLDLPMGIAMQLINVSLQLMYVALTLESC